MSKELSFDCLLFDLDGTLVDSKNLMANSILYCLRNEKIKAPSRIKILKDLSISPKKILGKYGIHILSDYWNYYEENISQIRFVNKRLHGFLDKLKDDGILLGIVTSLPKRVTQKLLEDLNLIDYFDVVVTYGDTKKHKPHPDPILKALKKLKANSESTLYIGDLPEDIKAGREANVSTGAALWGISSKELLEREQPLYLFNRFSEIIKTVNKSKELKITGYIPHEKGLRRKRRKSCLECNETADCLNCSILNKVDYVKTKWWFWNSLKKEYLKEVKSAEWYIPSHANDEASKLVNRFKSGGENFKYRFRLGLSMALRLIQLQEKNSIFKNIDIIIPVPSIKKKIKNRGYNPPEVLAKVLGNMLDIPVDNSVLKTSIRKGRRRSRYEEDTTNSIERIKKNSFISKKHLIRGKKILLVDDVLTDGATIIGYSKALYDAVKNKPCIIGYTFACTDKQRN